MADFWKRLDEKTKTARVVAEVTATIASQAAVPVVKAHLAPPPPQAEIAQDIELDREKDWAEYKLRELREAGERGGDSERSSAEKQEPVKERRNRLRDHR